jgi:hypothetical protein
MQITPEIIMLLVAIVGVGLTMLGMLGAILAAIITAVWYLARCFSRYVTHSVCESRRANCPCWSEIEHVKQFAGIPPARTRRVPPPQPDQE